MTHLDIRNANAFAPLEPLKKEGLKDTQIVRMESATKLEVLGTRAAKKFNKLSDRPVTNSAGHTHLSPKAEVIQTTISYVSNTLKLSSRESLGAGVSQLDPDDARQEMLVKEVENLGTRVMTAASTVLQAGAAPEQKFGFQAVTVGGVNEAIDRSNTEVSKAYAAFYNTIHPSPREAPDGSQVEAPDTTTRQEAPLQPSGESKDAKMRRRRRRQSYQSFDKLKWKHGSGAAARRRSSGARHRDRDRPRLPIDEKAEVVLKAGRNPATVTGQTPVMEMASPPQTPIKDVAPRPVDPQAPKKAHHQHKSHHSDHKPQVESSFKRKRDDAGIAKKGDE